jgi:hypothetical protein
MIMNGNTVLLHVSFLYNSLYSALIKNFQQQVYCMDGASKVVPATEYEQNKHNKM